MASAINIWPLIDENSQALTDATEQQKGMDWNRCECNTTGQALACNGPQFANKWKIRFSNKTKISSRVMISGK